MKKHFISGDNQLNETLKAEVSTLRGGIVEQAHKHEMPSWFVAEFHKDNPSVIITNTETNKSTEVPLFAYGSVRQALNDLF